MEQRASKDFFRLNRGLNTEINELNFPDGFTTDEANYELLVDGSRRRRKGLAAEASAATAHTVDTFVSAEHNQTYVWNNVGGDPDKSVLVYRKGVTLYFADITETVSNGWYTGNGSSIGLSAFYTTDATATLVRNNAVSFSQGRGNLYVAHPYIKTFFVTYNSTSDIFEGNDIALTIRDYTTIADGVNLNQTPSTLSDDHNYNLRNRGWPDDRIDQFFTDQSDYPSKNMVWYKGYKRTYGASIAEQDGTRSWDSAKLDAEAFGASSAPVGSLFLDVYDTTEGTTLSQANSGVYDHSTWSLADQGGGVWWVTFTTGTTAHGLTGGETVYISGVTFDYYALEGGSYWYPVLNSYFTPGEYTVHDGTGGTTAPGTYTYQVAVSEPENWDSWIDQYKTLGQVDTAGATLTRSTGTAHGDGPRAVEFHDGRVFYTGFKNSEFADYIFFSQIVDDNAKIGRCYQEADPTDENFNMLTPSDGGYMVIDGLSGVLDMRSVRNGLLVFTNKGVWEISGGNSGVFTADGYRVRKITDNACSSADGIEVIEDSAIYTGTGGIYAIAPNQYTGLLEAKSISENTIQTLWNQIPDAEQKKTQTVYDNATKRLYFTYGADASTFAMDTMLIYDVRAGAWFKYTFDTPTNNVLLTGFPIGNADDTSDNKKMKFLYEASTTTVQVADFDQTDFDDWDGTNGPLPYMVFGHDNLGDWQRRRQAPVITVYSKRTETGYTSTGNGWSPDNESSTLMSVYWDWTDDSVSNKITAQQEVYRHVRNFVPSGTTDVDGYPVVVTRNKIRGRGRSLQMRFDGATDKDSHILGFTVNYKMSRKV